MLSFRFEQEDPIGTSSNGSSLFVRQVLSMILQISASHTASVDDSLGKRAQEVSYTPTSLYKQVTRS